MRKKEVELEHNNLFEDGVEAVSYTHLVRFLKSGFLVISIGFSMGISGVKGI